jgi:hypothetical protein
MDARLIYVFGTGSQAPAREQLDLVLHDPEGTRERAVGVVDVDGLPQVKLWYDRFDVPDRRFRVVLIDTDEREVWRADVVTPTREIWEVIDALPSRHGDAERDT